MNPPIPLRDDDIDPAEISAAAADETPADLTPPEIDARTRNLTAWDEPPATTGTAAPKVVPEDEAAVAEKLVYEGTDEAERDRRLAASDPDFEP